MADEYYAHIREDGTRQTVLEHLKGTAEYARAFGAQIGMEEEAVYAAMLHDVGKFTPGFQKRLLEGGPRVDHATAGMLEAIRARHSHAAYAIAGHHTGLADLGDGSDTREASTMKGKMKRGPGAGIEDYAAFQTRIAPVPPPPPRSADFLDFFLRTHMLFSALVDADWLDTERFMSDGAVERGAGESIARLAERFGAWLAEKGWTRPEAREDMTLNQMRNDILHTCMDRAAQEPGLFTLTVPTGGGKTTASLAFALFHALQHGLKRVIYVIPYTSIIDQTAKKFREILGDENVLEHHSQVNFDPEDDRLTPAQKKLQLATENWDAPVVVTTAVQFFESLFSCGNARNRKLHNVAKSVVIFDEAQMLPVSYLIPCVAAIARLSRDFGVSAVLCTATQPALNDLIDPYSDKMPVRELAPEPEKLNKAFQRTTVRMAGPLDDETLAGELNERDQVLCIVNSRRHAQKLFEALKKDGAFMLSTLFYPADRERKLEMIRARLKEGLSCRVVSTSLIEAGVDVDFPAAYRAISGLDSILQAAGRCNRENRHSAAESVVTVFEPERRSPRMFDPNIEAARSVLRAFDDPASLGAIREYFQILYGNKGDRLDRENIMKRIGDFAFRTISEKFEIIDQNTRAVHVLFRDGEAQALEKRLRAGERSRALFRALGRYAVNVYDDHFRALLAAGALERIDEGIWLMIAPGAYGAETGLALEPKGGEGYFA